MAADKQTAGKLIRDDLGETVYIKGESSGFLAISSGS